MVPVSFEVFQSKKDSSKGVPYLTDVCIHIGWMLVLLALQAALYCAQVHGAAHIAAVAGRICV